ncbi:hypothetical protein WA026_001421 [Henosepilachna vigintioctopunctata]|uniref:RING-type domain-containing protein n=1 Tax=Henosepilachna vigintioctopunctata TaxID=420089 RepID=A0AAW1UTC2_9CUCU
MSTLVMNKIKIIRENRQTQTINEDSIFESRKTEYSNCELNSNLPKKRKISDDKNFDDVSNYVVLKNANSVSKAIQASSSIQEYLEDELKCSICKEMFTHPVTVNCSHSFCENCIGQWKKNNKTCPICRQKITNQNVSIVLERCVNRLLEFSSGKKNKRKKKIVLEKKRLNTPLMSAPKFDDPFVSLEEMDTWDCF